MSDDNAYEAPATDDASASDVDLSKRPGGMTALAVLNFIFGGLGALGNLLLILGGGLLAGGAASVETTDAMQAEMAGAAGSAGGIIMILGIVGLVLCVLEIVGGIGYIKMSKTLGFLVNNIWAAGSIVISIAMAIFVGFGFGTVIGLVYPALILIFTNGAFKKYLVN